MPFRLFLWLLVFSGLFACVPVVPGGARAADVDSWALEASAEGLELREELLAAQLAYQVAAVAAAGEAPGLPDDERAHAWARFEFLAEKAAALVAVTGAHEDFLSAFQPFFPDPDGPDAIAGGGVASSLPPPLGAQRLRWLRALVLDRLERAPEIPSRAAAPAADPSALLFCPAWRVMGPFDIRRVGGFDLPLAVEDFPIDTEKRLAGYYSHLRWQPMVAADPLGRFDLRDFFAARPGAAACAVAWFRVERDRPGVLRLGADGPVALWVNGRRVGGREADAPLDPDDLAYPVAWKAGWNEVFLKLAPGAGGWRFLLRETPATPDALSDGIWSATAPPVSDRVAVVDTTPEAEEEAVADRGALTVFAGRVRADPGDHRSLFYLGVLQTLRSAGGEAERFRREEWLRRASDAVPASAVYRLALARAVADAPARSRADREDNLHRQLLEYAAALPEAFVSAQIDLGRQALDNARQPERAGAHAEQALEHNPMAYRARLLRADVNLARGWGLEAERELREAVRRHPSAPEARLRLARMDRSGGRFAAALAEYRAAVQADINNHEAVAGVIASLRRIDRGAEAGAYLTQVAPRLLRDPEGRRTLFNALVELSDWRGLRQSARTVLERNPGDTVALAAYARALEEGAAALAAASRRAERHPDDPEVRAEVRRRLAAITSEALPGAGDALPGNLGMRVEEETRAAVEAWRAVLHMDSAHAEATRRLAALRDRLAAEAGEGATPGTMSDPGLVFATADGDFPEGPGASAEAFRAWVRGRTLAPPSGADWVYLHRDVLERRTPDRWRIVTHRAVARALTLSGAAALGRQRIRLPAGETGRVLRARVLRLDGMVEEGGGPAAAGSEVAPFLPGVAPGDTVEWIIEYRNETPLFLGDHFAAVFSLAGDAWAKNVRYRVVFPPGASPRAAGWGGAAEPERTVGPDGGPAFVWTGRDVPARSRELLAPSTLEIEPTAAATTFRDWDDFARWYWRGVEPQWKSPPEIRLLAAQLRARYPDPLEALSAARRWVAQNIRHRDSPFDLHAFLPHSPRTILARRLGDGKDRALLLGLFARELGFDVLPTLAWSSDAAAGFEGSRGGGRGMEGIAEPPALALPQLFNHAGIRVRLDDGRVHVLDPNQPYALTFEMSPGLSAALVLAGGVAGAWFRLPELGGEGSVWEEDAHWSLADDGSAEWSVNVAGRGLTAMYLRAWFGPADRRQDAWHTVADTAGGRVTAAACDLWPELPEGGAAFSGRARLEGYAVAAEPGLWRVRIPAPFLSGTMGRGASLPGRLSDWAGPSERSGDLLLPTGFRLQRRLRLSWPEGWQPSRVPAPTRTETSFGQLAVEWRPLDGGLMIEVSAGISARRISRADYAEFRLFCALADEALALSFTLRRDGRP